MATGG